MGLDYETIMNYKFPEFETRYKAKDTILYALGLGFGADPLNEQQLDFVYEKNLKALPTMPVVLGFDKVGIQDIPELSSIDFNKLVHGEQSLVIHNKVPPEGGVRCETKILGILDKGEGKGAILFREKKLFDIDPGDLCATSVDAIFLRGNGGFGGEPGPAPTPPVHKLPESEPEEICDIQTLPQAALIYRLSGDYNPLHAEPVFAARAGFDKPILHGLCTFGVAAHAVLKTYCDYDVTKFKSQQVRFSAPFFPGETVRTEMWRDGNIISYRARSVERDVVVLNNGKVEV